MKLTLIKACVLAAAMSVSVSGYVHAQALEVLNPPIKVASKTKSKKARASRAKFDSGSQDTKKERTARLKRECKGGVDAGACSGYTK